MQHRILPNLSGLRCLPCNTPITAPLTDAAFPDDSICELCQEPLSADNPDNPWNQAGGAFTGDTGFRVAACVNSHIFHKGCLKTQMDTRAVGWDTCALCREPIHEAVKAALGHGNAPIPGGRLRGVAGGFGGGGNNSPPPPSSLFDGGGFGGGNGGFGGGNGGFANGGGNGGLANGLRLPTPPLPPPRTTPLDDILSPAFAFPAPFWSYDDTPGIGMSRMMAPPLLALQEAAYNRLMGIMNNALTSDVYYAVSADTGAAFQARIAELSAFMVAMRAGRLDSRVLLMLMKSMFELQWPPVTLSNRLARALEDIMQTLTDLARFGNLEYQVGFDGGEWNQFVDPALLGQASSEQRARAAQIIPPNPFGTVPSSLFGRPPQPPPSPPSPPPFNFTWPPTPPPGGPPAGFPDMFPRQT